MTPVWERHQPVVSLLADRERDLREHAAALSPEVWDEYWEWLGQVARDVALGKDYDLSPLQQSRDWLIVHGVRPSGAAATPERLIEGTRQMTAILEKHRWWAGVIVAWLAQHAGDAGPIALAPRSGSPAGTDRTLPQRAEVTWEDLPATTVESLMRPLLKFTFQRADQPSVMSSVLSVLPSSAWNFRRRWPEILDHVVTFDGRQTWPWPLEVRSDGRTNAWCETGSDKNEAYRGMLRRCDWTPAAVERVLDLQGESTLESIGDVDQPPLGVLAEQLRTPLVSADTWGRLVRLLTDRRTGEMSPAAADLVAEPLDQWLVGPSSSPLTVPTPTGSPMARWGWGDTWRGADAPERMVRAISSPALLERLSKGAKRRLVQHPDPEIRRAVVHALATQMSPRPAGASAEPTVVSPRPGRLG